jgi:ankyrin repeat protein
MRATLLVICSFCAVPVKGADPEVTTFFDRLEKGDADGVRALLVKNPKLALSKDQFGESAIGVVASRGNVPLADLLLAAGAQPDIEVLASLGKSAEIAAMLKLRPEPGKALGRALLDAAWHGHLEVAKLLLERGADPNFDIGFPNTGKFTPLTAAVEDGHLDFAILLCEHGAKTDVCGGKDYGSLLHLAIAERDEQFVKLLLKQGADAKAMSEAEVTPLHVAAIRGSVPVVRLLLEHGADVKATTPDGCTPLYFAAVNGNREVGEYLISRGAKVDISSACALGRTAQASALLRANPRLVNTRDKRLERTPLFWAAAAGDLDLVKLLIEQHADVNLLASDFFGGGGGLGPQFWRSDLTRGIGETALHVAARNGHAAVAKLLLSNGASPNVKTESGATPLHIACANVDGAMVKLLIDGGADVRAKTQEGISPLRAALDSKECVVLLLAAGADPSEVDKHGDSLVFTALDRGHPEVADVLVGRGAKLDIYSAALSGRLDEGKRLISADPKLAHAKKALGEHKSETPLMLAAQGGHLPTVQFLFSPDALDAARSMVSAAEFGHANVVAWLIDKGASADAKSEYGYTALIGACLFSRMEVVRLLLDKDADQRAKTRSLGTALHCVGSARRLRTDRIPLPFPLDLAAQDAVDLQIARWLIERGANVNARNRFGETPLHIYCGSGRTSIVKLLLEKRADVNARNNFGHTPLWVATRHQESDRKAEFDLIAQLLLKEGAVVK